mmetsp:Transcript_58410/g.178099  ORF Transcript_58410/g.178099 Transcript_58410/m.178099 type:complete len:208 (-) Transcript_58410:123-746(-)
MTVEDAEERHERLLARGAQRLDRVTRPHEEPVLHVGLPDAPHLEAAALQTSVEQPPYQLGPLAHRLRGVRARHGAHHVPHLDLARARLPVVVRRDLVRHHDALRDGLGVRPVGPALHLIPVQEHVVGCLAIVGQHGLDLAKPLFSAEPLDAPLEAARRHRPRRALGGSAALAALRGGAVGLCLRQPGPLRRLLGRRLHRLRQRHGTG